MRGTAPILLVTTDRPLREALARELTADGYPVAPALSARDARSLARLEPPELVLIGPLEIPGDSTALVREIRTRAASDGCWADAVPVIVLGSEADAIEALRAFDAGADDFLAAPHPYLELRARLEALLRRSSGRMSHRMLRVGSLLLDLQARRASVSGRSLELCRIEFELLARLASDPERAFTRGELLLEIWGYPPGTATRTLDTHACRLRQKLDAASAGPWLPGVRGVGYRLI